MQVYFRHACGWNQSADSQPCITETDTMSTDETITKNSPCTLICTIDTDSNMCLGCGRTPDEIADWSHRSQADRNRILSELPARMPALEAKLAERHKLRRPTRRRIKSGGS